MLLLAAEAGATPYGYAQWLARVAAGPAAGERPGKVQVLALAAPRHMEMQGRGGGLPGLDMEGVGASAAAALPLGAGGGGRPEGAQTVVLAQAATNIERTGSAAAASGASAQRKSQLVLVASKDPEQIGLYPGEVKVLPIARVDRVAIGNGSVVTATIVDDKQIVLLGEAIGRTTMHLWLKNGRQMRYEVHVTGVNATEQAATELRQILVNETGIDVAVVNEKVVLSGEYSSAEGAEKVKRVLQMYPVAVNMIKDRPAAFVVPKEQMILMEVKVIEARKSAIDSLGIKWSGNTAGPTITTSALFYSNSKQRPNPAERYDMGAATPARPFLSFVGMASEITSMINFLESNGDSWTLAEPRVSTINGGKSKVRVGGEVPVPVTSGFGQVSVTYKEYGVILEIEPVVDSSGYIRSKITTEVSRPDPSTGAGDFTGFITNRTETDVSLTEGESLVISGLLHNSGGRSEEAVPGLGKVPVMGRLFSNRDFVNDRTEMLVIVTPRLHVPGSASAKALEDMALQQVQRIEGTIQKRVGN
ncbi:MAG: pilus assembly protein N-terminal domain-containing protein [Burkholderiaceae bacterium]|nr:pilus assembly protein N-terminal domain-containing protein [Burkholderiaceae bacterium]